MSEELRPPVPFSEEEPLFENNNRRGRSRGEAIFGDKQAAFNTNETNNLTLEGQEQLAAMEVEPDNTTIAIGSLAAKRSVEVVDWARQQEAAGIEVTQDRLDLVEAHFRRKGL